jgi:putative copper export protein
LERQDWLLASLLIHVPAVVTWISLVGAELVIGLLPGIDAARRGRMLARLRWPTVVLVVVILVTGTWQTIDNPFLQVDSFSALERLRTTKAYGEALFVKHIFVLLTFVLSLLVTFVLSRRIERGGSLRPAIIATVCNLAACLGALLATVGMTVQLH